MARAGIKLCLAETYAYEGKVSICWALCCVDSAAFVALRSTRYLATLLTSYLWHCIGSQPHFYPNTNRIVTAARPCSALSCSRTARACADVRLCTFLLAAASVPAGSSGQPGKEASTFGYKTRFVSGPQQDAEAPVLLIMTQRSLSDVSRDAILTKTDDRTSSDDNFKL